MTDDEGQRVLLLQDVLNLPPDIFHLPPSFGDEEEEEEIVSWLKQHSDVLAQIQKLRDVVSFLQGRLREEVLSHLEKDLDLSGQKRKEKSSFKEKLTAYLLPCGALDKDTTDKKGLEEEEVEIKEDVDFEFEKESVSQCEIMIAGDLDMDFSSFAPEIDPDVDDDDSHQEVDPLEIQIHPKDDGGQQQDEDDPDYQPNIDSGSSDSEDDHQDVHEGDKAAEVNRMVKPGSRGKDKTQINSLFKKAATQVRRRGRIPDYGLNPARLNKPKAKEYPCTQCEKTYLSEATLQTHILKAHKTERPFPCPQCPKAFAVQRDVRHHVKHVHSGKPVPKVDCPICSAKISAANLGTHIRVVHKKIKPKKVSCTFPNCKKQYQCPSDLRYHISKVHLGTHKGVVCDMCGNTYATSDILKLHVKFAHLGEFKHFCPHCGRKERSKAALERHIAGCLKRLERKKKPQCDVCQKQFTKKEDLVRHKAKVHLQQPFKYPCEFCGKAMSNPSSLRFHQKKSHPEQFKVECQFCGYLFLDEAKLQFHHVFCSKKLESEGRSRSQKKGEFPCSDCSLVLKTDVLRQGHIARFHSGGQKPFQCDKCSAAFAVKEDLPRHVRKKHGQEEELTSTSLPGSGPETTVASDSQP